jgi:hypothetical protein
MDEDLKAYLQAMEDRLMRRINDNHAAVLIELRDLHQTTDTAREYAFRVPKLVVEALEAGLLPRLRAIEDRIGGLEGGRS